MSGTHTLAENIAKLEAAEEDVKTIVREAHETIKTAKLVLKEPVEERERWEIEIRDAVDAAIETQVKMGLESFHDQIKEVTSRAHQDVIEQFTKLTNLMMYGNEKGKGQSVIEDWVRKAVRDEIKIQIASIGRRQ